MRIGVVQQIWRHPVKSMAGERLEACTVRPLGIQGDRGWALRDERNREITNGKRIPLIMQCAAQYRSEPADGLIPTVDITFPDGTTTSSEDRHVNSRLSEVLGKEVTLWPLQPATNKTHYRRADPSARIAGLVSRLPGFRSLLPKMASFGSMNIALREVFSREPDEPIPDISTLPAEVLEFTSPLGTYFDAFPINVLTTASLETMASLNPTAVWDVRRFRPNFLIKTNDEIRGLAEAGWAGRTLRVGEVQFNCEIPTARCGMTTHGHSGLPKDPSVLRSIVKDADQNLGVYASVVQGGGISIGDEVELI
ncbi:MAG: MOSC domain-containing protein [Pyrinomonadaceae bacterium]